MKRDLVVLVPDKSSEFVVRGALTRPQALGIRPISAVVLVDPGRDGGVRSRGTDILRLNRPAYSHALMLFDHEGCGSTKAPSELERELDTSLASVWGANAKTIVIEPEIDIWMWGAESHLKAVCDWGHDASIRSWLRDRAFAFNPHGKPKRPKEALQAVLRHTDVAQSAALYQRIAARITLARCSDPAFLRLRERLTSWFPRRG